MTCLNYRDRNTLLKYFTLMHMEVAIKSFRYKALCRQDNCAIEIHVSERKGAKFSTKILWEVIAKVLLRMHFVVLVFSS